MTRRHPAPGGHPGQPELHPRSMPMRRFCSATTARRAAAARLPQARIAAAGRRRPATRSSYSAAPASKSPPPRSGGWRLARAAAAQAPADAELRRRAAVRRAPAGEEPVLRQSRASSADWSRSCNPDPAALPHGDHDRWRPGHHGGRQSRRLRSRAQSRSASISNLPHEQYPNPYVTPELCFRFHYFAMRKLHFLQRARALVAFPGGFGTLDELFETLTLLQTRKMARRAGGAGGRRVLAAGDRYPST